MRDLAKYCAVAVALAACGSRPLGPSRAGGSSIRDAGPSADAGPDADRDGGNIKPVANCEGELGSLTLEVPCLLGRYPTLETDCDLGGLTTIRFLLPFSLARNGMLALDTPIGFDADLIPAGVSLKKNGNSYELKSFTGTVTFKSIAPQDQTFDGWLTDAAMSWTTSSGATLRCSLQAGRFYAIPGKFD